LLVLLWCSIPFFAHSQDNDNKAGDIFISSSVDKTEITIGDLIVYTVTVNADKRIKVKVPAPGVNLGSFDIRDYSATGPELIDNNRAELVMKYIITTYDVGTYTIPGIKIKYVDIDGKERSLTSQDICIKVKRVSPKEAKDIKDIKPPAEIKSNLLKYWWIGLLILIVIVILIAVIVIYQRQAKVKVEDREKDMPVLPPDIIALEKLRDMENAGLPDADNIKEYYAKVSDILREYIKHKYGIPATELTTNELIDKMKELDIDAATWIQNIYEFLYDCDLVKFAKYQPSEDVTRLLINRAKEIIEATPDDSISQEEVRKI
jgi:hypothetical protein